MLPDLMLDLADSDESFIITLFYFIMMFVLKCIHTHDCDWLTAFYLLPHITHKNNKLLTIKMQKDSIIDNITD